MTTRAFEHARYDGTQIKVPVGKSGLGDVAAVAYRELVGRQTGAIPSDWAFPCS